MFKVTPYRHLPANLTLVASGTVLGRWTEPVAFDVTSDIVPNPLRVEFRATRDGTDDKGVRVGDIENYVVTVSLKNPPMGQTISSKEPRFIIAQLDRTQLTFSFAIHGIPDGDFFVFIYEFYEETLPPATPPKSKEGQA